MTQKFKSVSLRIPVDLHERFTATARDSDRSFNAAALLAMQDYVHSEKHRAQGYHQGSTTMTLKPDYSGLEERVMQRLNAIEAKLDHPLREVHSVMLNVDTESETATQKQIKEYLESQGANTGRYHTGGFTSRQVPPRKLHLSGCVSREQSERVAAEVCGVLKQSPSERQEALQLEQKLEYWKGCTCVTEIPAVCTDQELVRYYERNCTKCGRNYEQTGTGKKV